MRCKRSPDSGKWMRPRFSTISRRCRSGWTSRIGASQRGGRVPYMIMRRLLLLAFSACLLFGADQKPAPKYEMTNYIMGLLRRGPKWTPGSTEETKRIQEGHMANINK